jgi:hypothetical protein
MRDEAIGPSLQINPQKASNAAPIHAAPFTVPTPQHSVPLSSKVPPLCTIVSPRSFYIRFAKFTLLPFVPPGSHPSGALQCVLLSIIYPFNLNGGFGIPHVIGMVGRHSQLAPAVQGKRRVTLAGSATVLAL